MARPDGAVTAPNTLALAWARVQANQGAAGVDGQSVGMFEAKAEAHLAELAEELRGGTYLQVYVFEKCMARQCIAVN